MFEIILKTIWFILPAVLANMAASFSSKIPLLNIPIDFNKSFRGKRIFGDHKTIRGFLFGIIISILIVFIQKTLYADMRQFSIIDYSQINFILLGFLFGFGTLMGDAIESFFKRQINIKPGQPWLPFDQIDWILGSLLLALIYVPIPLIIFLTSLLVFVPLHFLSNYIGYYIKVKESKL